MTEEWIVLSFAGVVLVFIYSKMVYYSSLYSKVNEEYEILVNRNQSLERMLERYEVQADGSLNSIKKLQTDLKNKDTEIREVLSQVKDQKQKIDESDNKIKILYAQLESTL